jgi:hypothetical protein
MPSAGFEPTISAGERPQTKALDRAATGTGGMTVRTSNCEPSCTHETSDSPFNSDQIMKCTVKADSHLACRAHAVPLQCRAANGLECVFPIWFTQCGRVWFTLHIFMNYTRPHCVNQMGKTHSKLLAGTAWARHAMCESALSERSQTRALDRETAVWIIWTT